jgi:hypothetical protein
MHPIGDMLLRSSERTLRTGIAKQDSMSQKNSQGYKTGRFSCATTDQIPARYQSQGGEIAGLCFDIPAKVLAIADEVIE